MSSESLLLDADTVRLAQVFGNLLTNAAKYTEPKGRIWLTAERAGEMAVVRIRDEGIGTAIASYFSAKLRRMRSMPHG